ncbi:MAG: isoleucine--tRNA ligase [Bacteroidaceae bacterium]|nr:isoleucine--tRNA ligase [Bacteroidaceae bacterium]
MSKNKFKEYQGLNLPEINKEVLAQWMKEDLFAKSLEASKENPTFVFFEGPPSANGHPGIHHVLARTIKDTVCRYKSMKGYHVPRKAGWDTHGLPVELSVEKTLGISKEDIGKKISVDDYNNQCRADVMKYTAEWRKLSEEMGYWVDLDHPYITYENSYIETLWWLLKQLYDKGLLYKGYTIQPYSPAAGTGLSSHELNQPGCYRDVKDTTVTAQFRIRRPSTIDNGQSSKNNVQRPMFDVQCEGSLPIYILAWTTTPWTLPSNTALCVGPKIDYVAVKGSNPYTGEEAIYILAESRLSAYFKAEEGEELPILWRGKGTDLIGLHYEQLFPWVKPCALEDGKVVAKDSDAFRVIPGDYVTTEDGTGIVHIAPTFGADDAKVAKDAGIPSLFIIDKAGDTRPMVDFTGKYFVKEDMDEAFVDVCVNESYWHHSGDYVKNAYDPRYADLDEKALAKTEDLNIVLCMEMKQEGTAFKIEKHIHNYPHCWRTDKPVLYYPLDSWFIRSTAARERMMELNRTILWKPESTGTGRFGKWLENLNDWNLSRSRYWGTPLPIWRNRDTREELCIGSIQELYDEIERSVSAGIMQSNPLKDKGFVPGDYSDDNYHKIDLHRPYVDDIVLVSPTGHPMRRELDLIDVWFDSGAMPYAQIHYPFENKEAFDQGRCYPSDFIAEGVDQTRGWFFTLHAIATMVFDSVAYKAVISNGLVLDKNGNKMSKRLGNAVDPFDAIARYGSDPLRWYMITNSQPWDNLRFDEKGVQEVARSLFSKLYQTYSFFAMYANVDGFTGEEPMVPVAERQRIDRWIISALHTLVKRVTACYEDYDLTTAGRLVETFVVDDLSNWYVRLNRKRFWRSGLDRDKLSAYQSLYACLETVARLMAPLAPFYTDRLYRDLKGAEQSIHLQSYPVADPALIDTALESQMQRAQKITSMGLSLRKKEKIIVRQPLQSIMLPVSSEAERQSIEEMSPIITSELNVKEIRYVQGINLVKTVKCNFRVMGKKLGKLMGPVSKAVGALSQEEIVRLETDGSLSLIVDGQSVTVERDDVEIYNQDIPGWSVANDGTLTVALDLTVTPELRREGMAREVVKRIQTYRKEQGFEITDHIAVTLEDNAEVREAVEAHRDFILTQVLCDSLTFEAGLEADKLDFEDFVLNAKIDKN